MTFVFTVISQLVHAQSGSFGSTYVHTGMEMGIFGQHNFVTGSGTINAGIVGSERQPVIGVYSFVDPSGSWISASNTAFVDGYVRTYNTGAFTFPIGDNNKYRPAAVSASSAAAPTTAAYYGVDPGLATTSDLKGGTYGILPGGGPAFPTTSKVATVGVVDNVEYWDIDGTTPARITLTWDANTPISAMVGGSLSNLTIVGWDGTQWVAIPSTVDAASLLQNTSASAFTGPAGTVTAGSITTTAAIVPGSYTVYTLAGSCPTTGIVADITSQTICSGEMVSINYTTTPAGAQTVWVRQPGNFTSLGNVTDFPTATGSTPTSYTYTGSVTSFGCPSLTAVTTVLVNPVPIVTPSFCSQTICSGQTGAITFTTTIPNSTIHWVRTPTTPAPSSGTGDISQSLINTGPTSLTYTYLVWAESPSPASCPSSTTITCEIVVNPSPPAGEVRTLAICNNETVDLATYFPAGGSYTALNGSMTGSVFSGIASGVGSFTVSYTPTDICLPPTTVVVVVRDCTPPPCKYPISAGKVDATCGNSDGTAAVSIGGLPTGASAGFTWSNGKSGPNVSGLAAGVYSVTATITSANGACTVVDSVNINDIGAPIGEIQLITSADCLGNNGAVAIDITPGSPTDVGPFKIVWTGAASGIKTDATAGVNTISSLAPGSYIFEISSTTSNTACSSFLAITIPKDDSDQIAVTAVPTNATACGSFTGSIVITATPAVGVTGPFSYSLDGVAIGTSALPTYTITGLKAGVYMVSVSSAGGCTSAEIPVTILETGAPVIAGWTPINPTCPSDQGKLVFAGGQPTATFLVRDVTTGSIVSPTGGISGASSTTLTLPAGTYSIESTATSSTCTSFTTVTITVPEGLKFNVEYTKVNCAPGGAANNDGTITVVQIMGGTGPYSTTVTNAQNQVMASASLGVYTNLAPGVYNVKVFDSKGCSGVESVFVTVPDCKVVCPTIPMDTYVVDANCGASDGHAVATLGTFADSDVTYEWSNGSFGNIVTGLSSGVYSVTATVLTGTFVGCPYVKTVNVNDIGGPLVEQLTVVPSSCSANTGIVTFKVTTGTTPLAVTWVGPVSSSRSVSGTIPISSFPITGLAAGNYVFTFTSANSSCETVLDVTIPVSSSSAITLAATPNPTSNCGAQDGSINLTALGSGPNYTFSLNGSAYTSVAINTVSIPNLPAGVYRVGVTSGANGCQTERIVTIGETGAPSVTGWTSQSALCALDQGSLTYAGGSGAGTYRVLLGATEVGTTPENATGPVVFSLPQGVYTVELKNGACTSFQNFTIAGPAGIDFNVQYVAETCAPGGVGNGDGTLEIIQINGGTKPYTVSIINNQGQVLAGASHTNLPAGNYFVSVVDAHGCTGNNGALVTVPPCQLKCPPLAFNTSVIDNECGKTNGEATASLLNVPVGATPTYQWSNGQNGPIATGLTSGVYSVTATLFAANTIYDGCMYVDTVNVNDIGGPVASVSAVSGASCTAANGSAALNIQSGTGPFTVSWTGVTSGTQPVTSLGLVNIPGLKAGNYVFTVTDATTSCKSVIDVVIPNRTPNGFTLAITPTNTTGCGASDGSIKVVVTGGTAPFTYSVNGYVKGTSASRTFTASGLPAGVNVVEVMDANGCVVQKDNILINPTGPTAIAGWTKTDALCPQNTGIIQYGGAGNASDEYVVTIAGTATEIGRNFGNVPTSYSVSGGTYLITRTTSTSCVSVTTITVNQPDGLDFNIQFTNPTCLSPASGSFTVVQPSGGTAPYSYTITGPTGVVSTQASVTSLPAGSYTITMGDSRGCTYSNIKVLTTGSNLTVTASATPAIVCVGQPISLSALGTGGSPQLTYAWTGPAGFVGTGQTTTATATVSGSYTVVVTDAVGCTAAQSTSVTVGATPTVAATPSTVCVGQTVTLDATPGGTSYAWSGPNFSTVTSGPSVSILNAQLTNAGVYSVTITGGNGCTGTTSTTVTVNAPPSVTALVSNSTVCVGSSLVLTASASPTGSYTFTWSGPNSFTATGAIVTINNALATNSGSYTVIATSASGCSSSAVVTNPVTVTVCCQPFGLNILATNANCGQSNGEATVTASGGSGNYTYLWSNGATGSHVTGLLAGSYTVVVADAAGCSSSTVVSISNVEAPQLAVLSTTPATCLGATGTASVTATGGVAPLSYVWSTGTTGSSLAGVVAGVYSVTVIDSKGCLDIAQVTIGTSPGSLTGVISSTPSACSQASGSATLTASGSSGYTYVWNTGATTSSISGLVAGIYSVTVTDGNGCVITNSVSIDDTSGPSVVVSVTAVSCNGSSTGRAVALASGGSGTYSYLWSNGMTTSSLSGLSAGLYSVVVTDANGCKSSDDEVLVQPASLLAELSPTTIACGSTTGDITLTSISGGSGVYSYQWSNGMTTSSLSGVVAGAYSLTITDSNGCIATGSATLVLPTNCTPPCDARDISLVAVNPQCGQAGGSITATLSGTVAAGSVITTSWRNVVTNAVVATNVMSVSGLAAGSYTVSVTVSSGSQVCSYSAITSLSDVGSASLVVSATTPTDCAVSNGSATLTVSGTGSLTVSYSGPVTGSVVASSGVVSLSGLSAGQYSVTVKDAQGCTAVEDFVIAPKGSVALNPVATATPASCTGTDGSVTVSWSALAGVSSYSVTVGGQSTVVSGTSATFSGLPGGSYMVTVSVAGNAGCGISTTAVTVPTTNGPALVVSTVQPLCVGGTGVITVVSPQGGVVYSLLTSAGTLVSTGTSFTVLPGSYVVAAVSASCVSTTVVTITLPLSIDFNVSVSPGACGRPGSLTVSNLSGGTGTTTTTVRGPSGIVTNLNNLATGSYTVVVSDQNGCSSSEVVSVTATAPAPSLAIVSTDANCGQSNGEATVTASGGSGNYTYLWSNGATGSHVTGLLAGSYTVVVADAAGCSSSTVVSISNVEAPQLAVLSTTPATCLGATGAASVTATGGVAPLSYVWSTGTTGSSLAGVMAGVYSVTVIDSKGCLDIAQVTIGTSPGSLTGVISSTPSACSQASGSATLTASGSSGYTYLWNTGATTSSISGLVAGIYSVTVTDGNGCVITNSVSIDDTSGPSVVVSVTAVSCNGSSTGRAVALASGGSGTYSYLWSNGMTTSSLSGLSAGLYSVVVTDANGCKSSDDEVLVQPASLLAELSPTTIACGSTTGDITLTSISGGSGVYSYQWSNGMTTSSLSGVVAGAYSLTITDSNGCIATGSATLVLPTNCTPPCDARDISLVAVNPQCGQAGGSITATLSGTVAAGSVITTSWRNVVTNAVVATNVMSVSGLAAGSYTVSVTVSSGSQVCSYSAITSLSDVGSASLVVSATTPTDCAVSNGSATLTVSGTGSLTVSYSGPVTGSVVASSGVVSLSGLSAGQYSVTVKDAQGCTAVEDFVIAPKGSVALNPVATATPASCTGTDGSVTVSWSALAGVSSYSVTVGGQSTVVSGTSATFSGLPGGSYMVTVSVAGNAGCGISTTAVTVPTTNGPALVVSTVQPLCVGGTGVITVVSPQGGVVYSLLTSAGTLVSTGTSFTVLPGSYVVAAVSASCVSTTVVTITLPLSIDFNVSVSPGACGRPGSLTVSNLSGGTGTTTTTVRGPSGIVTNLNNLATGSYTVVVSDQNGCSSSEVVSVTATAPAPSLAIVSTDANCGQSNGEATVTASGGSGNYTYLWSNGATGSHVTGLLAGSYTVVVADAAGCSSSTVVSISNVEAPQLAVLSTTPATCLGATGAASVTATGGVAPLSYVWSTGTTGSSLAGVVAGVYSVTVIDSKGCLDIAQVTIGTSPGSLTGVISSTPSACSQASGSATLTASGSSGYTYLWNTGATTSSISGLVAGIYSVTVTDGNGCVITNSVSIDDTSGPSVVVSVTAVSCNGSSTGRAVALASGGTGTYSYLWSNGMTTSSLSGLSAGLYSVVVTDANGCKSSDDEVLVQPASLLAELSPTTIACGSTTGDITLTSISGGSGVYSYQWSNGMTTSSLSGVVAGAYSLTITDSNGCVAIGQATLLTPTNCPICVDPVLTLTGPVCNTVTGLSSLTYVVSNGASVTANTGTIDFVTNTINNIPLNTVVVVTATAGCGVSSETVVTGVTCTSCTVAISAGTPVCLNGTTYVASVTASAGSSLTAVGGSFNPLTGLVTGVVGTNVTVIATNGSCIQARMITSPTSCTSTCTDSGPLVSVSGPVCDGNGSTYTVNYVAGAGVIVTSNVGNYTLVAGRITGIPLGSGVTITAISSVCSLTQVTQVAAPSCPLPCNITLAVGAISPVACVGGTISLTATVSGATTPVTYVWSGPNFSTTTTVPTANIVPATAANSGSYTVVITDANGCSKTAVTPVSVTVTPAPTPTTNVVLSICNNETVDLATHFPAGGTFTELTSSSALTGSIFNGIVSQAGTYRVQYTSAVSGCGSSTAIATIVVRSCSPPPCNFPISTAVVDANCGANDGRAQALVGGLPNGATIGYNWSNGASGPQITGLVAGVYSVTATVTNVPGATYQNGCILVDTVNVNDIGGPVMVKGAILPATCPNNNNGQVTLDIQSGTPSFIISYTGPSSGSLTAANLGPQTVSSLAAGDYVFRITSTVNGVTCSGYLPVHIPRDDAGRISVTPTVTNAAACGSPTGTIQYNVTLQPGVLAPFTYLLDGQVVGTSSLPTFTLTNVVAGAYVIRVISANGCTAADVPVIIEDTGAPAITGWTAIDAKCPSDVASIVFAGGQPATTQYRVTSVVNGGTIATVTGNQSTTLVLSAGPYAVIRTSTVDNCTSVDTLIINAPTGLDFNVQYKAATCGPDGSAQNDGSITVVQIEGGVQPYTVRVLDSNNAVVSNTNALSTGNYVIEVRDKNNCAGIQQLLITIPDCRRICPVLPLNTVVVDANCGASDGTATASLGGLPAGSAVNYTWSNGQNGPTAVGLSTGIYNVTATVSGTPNGSSIGCLYVGTVNVNEIGGPIPSIVTIVPSRCSVNTGMVSLSLTAGTAPYKVSWTGPVSGTLAAPNPSSVLIQNLAPGSYTVVVTGSGSNCQGVINVTVPVSTSADITLTALPTNVGTCGASNGSLAVTVTGGTPNYSFTLNGIPYVTQASGTLPIPNLPAGYYNIGVTSANGCTTSTSATIGTSGGPAVSGWSAQSPLCPDNTGVLTFAGGQAATVTYRVLLGGTTLLATVPGTTSTTLAVSRGVYVIERRDNNCISSYQSFTITSPEGMDFNVQYTGETCAPGGGGNADGKIRAVQISGGTAPYSVTVVNSQNQVVTNLNALPAGQYTVRVTDFNSCTGASSILITVPPCPQVCPALAFDKVVVDTQCGQSSGTATATLLGAPTFVTYQWSNGQNGSTATGLASGTYSVTATITSQNGLYNGCRYVDVVHVNDIGGPIANLLLTTGASCTASNGSAILDITGGVAPYTVSWTGAATGTKPSPSAGQVLINGLPAGDYVFSVSGGTSTCRSLVEVTIPHNDTAVMQVTATPTDVSGCGASNGSIALNVTGGMAPFLYTVNGYITLSSSSRTPSFPNLPAGSYTVMVSDANGCSVAKKDVLINTQNAAPIAGWSKTDGLCAGSAATLVYTPAPGVASDQYVVRISGSNTIVGQTAGNVALTLNVAGGTYLVTRTSSNSCVAVDTLIVNKPQGLEINVQYGQPTCTSLTSGSIAVVQISGGTEQYTTTVTSATGVVANLTALAAGSYTVTVGDAHGCKVSQVVSLTIGQCNFCFNPYVYLQGALVNDDGIWPTNPVSSTAVGAVPLMRDDLRALGIIPLTDPYRAVPYITTFYPGGLGSIPALDPFNETIVNPAVTLADRGENSVVDWVLVEFRDKTDPSIVKYTRSGLVLRNGTIVDVDGTSCLNISHVAAGDYYIAVRHRNHLGAMTQTTRSLNVNGSFVTVDFRTLTPLEIWHDTSDPNIVNLYGDKERRDISWKPGYYALWGGNANRDDKTIYQGQLNDPQEVFNQITTEPLASPGNILNIPSYVLNGYYSGDVNMNGKTIFQGQYNDTHIIYNIMIQHPSNVLNTPSFIIVEQLP